MLRKSSLDELPQLFNVLRGEMSCVGPRPIVQDELGRYGSHMGEYLQARPGLTGLWQVSGRSSTDYAERVSLDSHYVRNWSLWLDLVILLRTVIAVMRFDRAS
jgi:exopolysaccharide production protein ExoY